MDYDNLQGLSIKSSVLQIVAVLLQKSVPIIFVLLFNVSASFISLIFSNYSQEDEKTIVFSGISLACILANVSCYSIMLGMSKRNYENDYNWFGISSP